MISSSDLFFPTYIRFPKPFVRGRGMWLFDSTGRRYLDMFSGIGVNSLGYSHPAIVSAIRKQAQKHLHLSNLFSCSSQVEFAKKVLKTVPFNCKVFLVNSGTEAVETAIKLARMWGRSRKFKARRFKSRRFKILAFEGSFHGRTFGSLSATHKKSLKDDFKPLVPGFVFAKWDDIDDVRRKVDESFCAILLEPIQGEGGVKVPSIGFLRELKSICSDLDILFILDEIQTGVGKTGKFWCFENFGIAPHIFVSAKAIGGGLPLGVCIARDDIADIMAVGKHASTFGGNPLSCAAGSALIDIVSKDNFLRDIIEKGNRIKSDVGSILKSHKLECEVRGMGLLLGVDFSGFIKNPEDTRKAVSFFYKRGVLTNFAGNGDIFRIMPPFVISDKEIDFFIEIFEEFIKSLS